MKAAATVAQNGRDATRAHARLDQVESTQSQHSGQIATANTGIAANSTAITANTTAITTANTNITTNATNLSATDSRLGGTSQETFLGTLGQMAVISSAFNSGIGTLSHGGASGWNDSAVDDFNALNSSFAGLVTLFNELITELVNQGYMN
jgi:hypothetical protein